ncbi:efflux RND transporter periplasmic adaptor subunit [Henriciella sp. AS95]|uniref:efflux RND transporter periplasmic adaptor subunit n=1 Tax=Henriciella sp. AS95 TaxID=3135782 RepID=UPI00317A0F18
MILPVSSPDILTRVAARRVIAGALAGASLLALSACGGDDPAAAEPQQQAMQQQASRVEVIKAEPASVESVRTLPGRTTPFAQAEIRPQVTGLIQNRLFTEGEQVKAGQPLYQIDSAEYYSAVESAKAGLARAEASAATAQETAGRFQRLADIDAVSQQSYDEAVAESKQAAAEVGIQRAALERAKIDLARTNVRAPIDGQIGRSSVTPGALVTANQATPLARILQLDPIYVDMTASSAEVLRWKQDVANGEIRTLGETASVPVTVRFEDGSAYQHRGQIEFTEVSVDQEAGTVIIRAQVPNPDGLLLPGMFVKSEFAAGSYNGVYLVPQRAVQRTPKGDGYVFVASQEGTAQRKDVKIQESSGANWIVTDGLSPGDQVIVSGFQNVRDGAPVNVIGTQTDELASVNAGASQSTPE